MSDYVKVTRTNHQLKFKPIARRVEQHALFFYDIESQVDRETNKQTPYMLCYKIVITDRNFAILDTLDKTLLWENKDEFLNDLIVFYNDPSIRVTAFAHFHHYDLLTGDGDVLAELDTDNYGELESGRKLARVIRNNSLLDQFTGPDYRFTVVSMNTSSPKFFELTSEDNLVYSPKTVLRYKNSVTFIDTMNYFATSLEELGKSIGLYKGEIDIYKERKGNKELLAEAEEYCKNDVNIIAHATMNFLMRTSAQSGVPKSAPTAAFNLYARDYVPNLPEIFCHDHTGVLNRELAAYMGARTEVYLQNKEVEVHSVDANSLYPYVMRKHLYPTNLLSRQTSIPPRQSSQLVVALYEIIENKENRGIIAKVKVDVPEGLRISPIPKRFTGKNRRDTRLIFPTGEFETYLTTEEYKLAYNLGYIKGIEEYYIYEMADIFSKFVNDNYNARLSYASKGDLVNEQVSKLLLNSLGGKFGQTLRGKEYVKPSKTKYGLYQDISEDKKITQYQVFGHSVFTETDERIAYDSVPSIAAHITANARVYMWEIIQVAGDGNVYYIDNDGLKVNKQGYDNLKDYLHDTELGKLKLEYTGLFTAYVAKDYQVRNAKDRTGKPVTKNKDNIEGLIIRRKGVSNRAVLIEDALEKEKEVYLEKRATTPYDIMRSKGTDFRNNRHYKIERSIELHGRQSLEDGVTYPLHLDDESTYKTILETSKPKEVISVNSSKEKKGISLDFRKKD